jgi:hypothetical protein
VAMFHFLLGIHQAAASALHCLHQHVQRL